MKKYYDLMESKLVACIEWEKYNGSFEQAKKYFKESIREVTLKEFRRLEKEYCK